MLRKRILECKIINYDPPKTTVQCTPIMVYVVNGTELEHIMASCNLKST